MSGVKLKYIPGQCRIRIEFSKQDCLERQLPPKGIYERAKQKLEEERYQGRIAHYYLDFPRLVSVWRRLAASWEDPDTTVAVTLGAGTPSLRGCLLTTSDKPDTIAEISFNAVPAEISKWRLHFLKITVDHQLRELGINAKANSAELQSIWLRAVAGEKVSGVSLHPVPELLNLEARRTTPYDISVDPYGKYITLAVFDLVSLLDLDMWDRLKKDVSAKVEQLSEQNNLQYEVLTEDLILRLRSAMRGPERYGIDLPFLQLVASPSLVQKPAAKPSAGTATAAASNAKRSPKSAAAPAEKITFQINSDKTSAKILSLPAALRKNPLDITADLIMSHAQQSGILHGFVTNLAELATKPDQLIGMVIATATPGSAGEQPSLQSVMKDVRLGTDGVRNRGPRKFVRAGEVIAVVQYGTEPQSGTNVCGESTPPPRPKDRLAVELGDGVTCEDGENYIATRDGTPEVTATDIRLVEGYHHEGEVNHTTGDLIMKGNVEITGSIEYGVVVKVNGDLNVGGDINGGLITCTGNLSVKGGIRSGDAGKLTVGGNVSAVFLENAKLFCDGSVTAEKSIIGSQIHCTGGVTVNAGDGLLSGGELRTGGSVKSANIGQDKGSVTRIKLGINWRLANKTDLAKNRLAKVSEAAEKYRAEVSELQRKRPEQRSKKMNERLEVGRIRSKKAKALVERLEGRLKSIGGSAISEEDGKILVSSVLSSNVDIAIAGQQVKITDSCQAVEVSGKRKNGSFVHKLAKGDAAA